MSLICTGRVAAAVVVVFGMTAFAQANEQSQSQPAPSQSAAAGQKVIVTGCVVRETDYRRSKDAGRGGVAGTGFGADNEFVLTSATTSDTATRSPSGPSPRVAYELTGKNEGLAAQHIGRRVEITGTLKGAETSASGAPTGGPSAGRPPSGVDVASKDLKLREIEVNSISEIGATCPAM
jgi:hypothetical protein